VRRENGNDDSSLKLGKVTEGIPPGQPTNLEAKAKGDQSMSGKRRTPEGV
jgi:hypothetical protein